MIMKTIFWIGPQREIPGFCVANTNKSIIVPESMANSYIKQGLAKEIKSQSKNMKGVE